MSPTQGTGPAEVIDRVDTNKISPSPRSVMPPVASTRDYPVPVRTPDSTLLADIAKDQEYLEQSASWAQRSNSPFLMGLGEKLFRLAFPTREDVNKLAFELATAVRGDAMLRLWLQTSEPGLSVLPWEYLCLTGGAVAECKRQGLDIAKHQPNTELPDERTFLALHPHVSLVRQATPQLPDGKLMRIGRLKVLVAWADPGNDTWRPISGLEAEVAAIRQVLADLPGSHVEWRILAHATPASLERELREFRPHVLHYAGHGAFPQLDDPDGVPAPALVLEAQPAARRHAYLPDTELRRLCAAAGVQVVALNSCWGAKATPTSIGIARTLTAPGPDQPVPVVVAHQMPIPQVAAAGFARPFYQNLVIGRSVEDGVHTFRADCVRATAHGAGVPDWGIPVIYSGQKDTRLFQYERVDLYPLNFGELIRKHVPIVGRKFLRAKITDFQKQHKSGIFLLTAPPGVGKTAFIAQLCEDDPTLVHFFYRDPGMTDPDVWGKSIYEGLRGRHGLLEENSTDDRGELRTRLSTWLLPRVSARCAESGSPEMILLDGLDESGETPSDHKNAIDVLPETLPEHVYLLVTSRPVPLADTLARRADVARFDLDPSSKDNLDDAASFCECELRGRVIDADNATLKRLGKTLAERAEGNFLVLDLFCGRESLGEQLSVADLERQALGLTGKVETEYQRFFERGKQGLANKRDDLKLLHRVLGAFATARAHVTPEQVCAAFDLPTEDWEWALGRVVQFLERGGVRQEEGGSLTYRTTMRRSVSSWASSWRETCPPITPSGPSTTTAGAT